PQFPDKVYKVEKALYGLHQALRAWYETLSTYLIENRFRRGTIDKTLFIKKDKGLQVQQKKEGIFISQDKYMASILKKFDFATVKIVSTPMEPNKALIKDEEADITPKMSHLHAGKRIFRYLKGQPKLGLWYPRDSPVNLDAFSDSDYARASLDKKSTTGGCQFLANVLWIQNQMLDYGFNFMNTKIFIDNECTIDIVKNPVFYSKTKHIEIKHHIIRDFYEKKLIQVLKIHTDHNVAGLLTKAFDVSSTAGLSLYCWMKLCTKVDAARLNLKFVDQHNMVACLEKTEENAEFHQIVDFLTTCSINYALTVSPTIYASYIEQFWNTATSKTVNSVKQIHAIIDGKVVVISESSVRSNLLFNDKDGIACLTNDEIFENLALMGYEQLSTKLTFQKG
ncbi:putative ribonuclease H-like domain-containing protein, partial [Tanacetum coccineum]